jgi:hypothetical protein
LRNIRRLAAALLIAVPLGVVISATAASANFVITPTVVVTNPVLASPQAVGAESFAGTYSAAVTGGGLVANFPLGQVTFNAIGPAPAVTATEICASPDFGTGSPSANIVPSSPDTVTYSCTAAAVASLLTVNGTYTIEAVFAPDATSSTLALTSNNGVTQVTTTTVQIFNQVTPTVTTAFSLGVVGPANTTTVPAGSAPTDTATIATTGGPTFSPATTVTFQGFANGTCTAPAFSTDAGVPVTQVGATNNGSATSLPFGVSNVAGTTESILATYSGNTFNLGPTAATCEVLITTLAAPSITTNNTPASVSLGNPLNDSVTISGLSGTNATGNVILQLHSGSATGPLVTTFVQPVSALTITGGSATFTAQFTPTAAGTYIWTSTYSGDINNAAATGPNETSTVTAAVVVTPPAAPSALVISTFFLTPAMHGRLYSDTVTATGGATPVAYTWSLSAVGAGQAMPPGLHINPATGTISGVAGAVGTYTFTVTVTDSTAPSLTTSKVFTLVIM